MQHVELAGWAGIQAGGEWGWRGGGEGAPVDAGARARGEPEQIATRGYSPRKQADVAQERAAALEDEDGCTSRAHAESHPRRHVHLSRQLQETPKGAARPHAGGVARKPDPTHQGLP